MPQAVSTSYHGATAIHAGYYPGGKLSGAAVEGDDSAAGGATPGLPSNVGGNATEATDSAAGGAMNIVPPWRVPAGTFGTLTTVNTFNSVEPAIYSSASANWGIQFDDWSGSCLLTDYSALGALVPAHGHGHLPNQPNVQTVTVLDLSTLTYATSNAPVAVNYEGITAVDAHGEFPDGTVFCGHQYNVVCEMTAAMGGGSKGSLAKFCFAGSSGVDNIGHSLDVSQATGGHNRMFTGAIVFGDFNNPTTGNSQGSYSGGTLDPSRSGYWVMGSASGDCGRLAFIQKVGGVWTVTYSTSNNASMNFGQAAAIRYYPAFDCLVATGSSSTGNTIEVYDCTTFPTGNWHAVNTNLGSLYDTLTDYPGKTDIGGVSSTYNQMNMGLTLIKLANASQELVAYNSLLTTDRGKIYRLKPTGTKYQNWVWNRETPTSHDSTAWAYSAGTQANSYNRIQFCEPGRLLVCQFNPTTAQTVTLTGM